MIDVTVHNIITGKLNTMTLPVTTEQLEQWAAGGKVQYVFPQLNTEQREFLITGMLPEEQI